MEQSFARLVREGQHPLAMVISCCDNRLSVSAIFNGRLELHGVWADIAGSGLQYYAPGQVFRPV